MSIRAYRETDFKAVLDIYAACKLDELLYERKEFKLLPLDQDHKRLEGFLASQVFVYERDGIKGYAAHDHSTITALYVHPSARGTGIGKILLQFMLDRIQGDIVLYVASSNYPAKRLYGQHGFITVDEFMTDYNGTSVLAAKMVCAV